MGMDFIDGRAIMSKSGPWSVAIGLPSMQQSSEIYNM